MRALSLAPLVLAAAALAACGGDPDEPARAASGACGVEAQEVVTGPFCLTRAGALEGLERAGVPVSCRPADPTGASEPWPVSLDRCRSGTARFRLVMYPSHNDALRARASLLGRLGIERPSHRVELSHNAIVVLRRESADGEELAQALERLGEEVV